MDPGFSQGSYFRNSNNSQMKLISSLIVLIGFAFLRCETTSSSQLKVLKANKVVLIFNKPQLNRGYTFENGISTSNNGFHEVRYIDDNLMIKQFPLAYDEEVDTITLNSTRAFIDVELAYKAIDRFNYLFQNGDTVVFTYSNNTPIARVTNRTCKEFDFNYEVIKRKTINKGDFPSISKLFFMYAFYNFDFKAAVFKDEVRRVTSLALADAETEFRKEYNLLDSLLDNKVISKMNHSFYKAKIACELDRLHLGYRGIQNDTPRSSDFNNFLNIKVDTLLYYTFYRDGLDLFSQVYFSSRVPRIISANGNSPNVRILYDTISKSPLLGQKRRRLLLIKNMEDIIKQSTASEIQDYISRFENDVKDSILSNHLRDKYNLDSSVSDELYLQTLLKEKVSIKNVLLQNKGKLVYVDIWASWCGPCIKLIPFSKELALLYKDKPITFVYLSKDEEFDRWKKAATRHGLTNRDTSFIIDNQFSSMLIEELKIIEIPRYLLFDKNGILIHKNAPSPDSEEIKRLLNHYINK